MARAIRRLSARKVETIAKPGHHADGEGLYLVVDSRALAGGHSSITLAESGARWVSAEWHLRKAARPPRKFVARSGRASIRSPLVATKGPRRMRFRRLRSSRPR